MGKVFQFENVNAAGVAVKDLEGRASQAVSAVATLKECAVRFKQLKDDPAINSDAQDLGVLNAKWDKAKTEGKAVFNGVTPEVKTIVQDYITFVLS